MWCPLNVSHLFRFSASLRLILASLDAGRSQMQLEGFEFVLEMLEHAMYLRKHIGSSDLITPRSAPAGPASWRWCLGRRILKREKKKSTVIRDWWGKIQISTKSPSPAPAPALQPMGRARVPANLVGFRNKRGYRSVFPISLPPKTAAVSGRDVFSDLRCISQVAPSLFYPSNLSQVSLKKS